MSLRMHKGLTSLRVLLYYSIFPMQVIFQAFQQTDKCGAEIKTYTRSHNYTNPLTCFLNCEKIGGACMSWG